MKEIRDNEQVKAYLSAFRIESVFNDQIVPHMSLYQFDPGESICGQGDVAQHLFVLVKGKVKIYTTSPEGKTLILSFKMPLEIIGDIEYVRDSDFINTVEAVSSVCMIGVDDHWLKKYADNDPGFLRFLLEIIARKFYIKSNSLSFNLMYPVEVRLASYILSVSFDASDDQFKGWLNSASLTDAANLIGTSYRHLNRVIRKLCLEGLIERKKGRILVRDRKGLSALAGRNLYE
ncbi:cyclic nucleotide-binding domain-containing protein [Sporolactobacillus shoreae]|uniref:Cyclic nucleotide-binding domain-containing protein n=1 Tax=Sporolactobacillus shoreae TaxID=1465501 RepID=A0A4Z0GJH1_9BACL|nr:cyclic nucleotide-binding domain-containing protein [Sporolactobacillus shoreae]TGA96024.1 cyclic nucleotide-binding domain-containing protein [Sporolactobacillus shoreae]